MNLAGVKTHFTNWRAWELNPIVIKELRQAVRSWAVTGMLLLFLIVLFLTSVGFLVSEGFESNANLQLGGTMFSVFITILAVASILFIPLYVGIRVSVERQDNNPDLLYVTTLSPARIIFGKFLCGAYMAVLFFSACMPFMAFTNLLRGVDLPTVFFILAYLFLVVCAANMVAIFLACIPVSRLFRILLGLGGFLLSFWVIIPLVMAAYSFLQSGIGAMMGERNFWIGALTTLCATLAGIGLFFTLAVELISPPSTNRALPVRGYITAIWLAGGLLALTWVVQTADAGYILAWAYPGTFLMLFALLVVIGNSDQLSFRVRRSIPRSLWLRVPAFVFYNGAAGGLIWVAAILALTYVGTQAVFNEFPRGALASGEDVKIWFPAMVAYALAYAMTALFVQRRFLPKRPPKLAGLMAVFLAALLALVPSIVLFFLNQLSWKSFEGLQLGNVFNLFSINNELWRLYHLGFAVGWVLLMAAVNARWFLKQVRNFRPTLPTRPPHLPPPLP